MGKKKRRRRKKGAPSVVKLKILGFLLERFTNRKLNINIFNHSIGDFVCNI